jgi:phospholipid N-methyltransferase
MNAIAFLKEFFANPATVGALGPSSPALAARIVAAAKLDSARVVIELGPGTGVFTEEILRRISPGTAFFAVERNERFAAATKNRCPNAVVWHDCATSIPRRLSEHGHERCDRILSGLPWASFPPELQDELLRTICDVLEPGGIFVTFAYLQGLLLPAGLRFRRRLQHHFGAANVTTTSPVWKNVPPAFIYCARRTGTP